MEKSKVVLVPLTEKDREYFILENQRSFKYGALSEFGERDNHVDKDGEIISRKTIEESLNAENNEAFLIMSDGIKVGGVVVGIDKETQHNHLDLLFTTPESHSKGIGYAAWQAIEAKYPETKQWETCTPYFEKRNIHFYVNKCGFQIVKFFNEFNPDPMMPTENSDIASPTEMFRFIKTMKS